MFEKKKKKLINTHPFLYSVSFLLSAIVCVR